MSKRGRSRRAFLGGLSRLGVGAAAWSALPAPLREAIAAPRAAELIERSDRPEQWEPTLAALGPHFLTPNPLFFVRCHFPAPDPDPAAWRLEIEGLASRGRTFALADLAALPQVERVVTLECAGNGRGLLPGAVTSGTQWARGAVGTARWGGVPLGELLDRVGASPAASHVWLEPFDQAPMPDAPRFVRSLPIEKARADVLLALTMNGAPLPRLHGGPLRAIVPGWYGMASTKWLARLRIEDRPSDAHFMARAYRWNAPGGDPAAAPPVEAMRIKSLITAPLEGATLRPGATLVQGFAWAGPAGVARVEVSLDGERWSDAAFAGDHVAGAWRAWALQATLGPGAATIRARATDGNGATQPLVPLPSAGGYGNNSIHAVTVHVRA